MIFVLSIFGALAAKRGKRNRQIFILYRDALGNKQVNGSKTQNRIDSGAYRLIASFLRRAARNSQNANLHVASFDDVAEALSDYIKLFDRLMKGWLSGRYDANDVQSEYYADLSRRKLYI